MKAQPAKFTQTSNFETLRSLLGSICLRRNKTVLPISASNEQIYQLSLTSEEDQEYNRLCEACLLALNAAVGGHRSGASHQTVIQAILRLRLFCNNGFASSDSATTLESPEMAFSLMQQAGEAICQHCNCDVQSIDAASLSGNTKATTSIKLTCEDCTAMNKERAQSSKTTTGNRALPEIVVDEMEESCQAPKKTERRCRYPTKLLRVCEDIQQHQQESKRYTPIRDFHVQKLTIRTVSYSRFGKSHSL